MRTLTFELPLPLRALSSNGAQGSWRKKAAARRAYREECGWLAKGCDWEMPAERARLSLVFGIKGGRAAGRYQPRDASNALSAFKPAQDSLVDAGLLVDDSMKHLELGEVRIDSTVGPFVAVRIEELA
jgi:hypothetical protein